MKESRKSEADHLLTLKTLYRMLTQPDYPSPSYSVFSEKSLRGQTLTRFWHTLLQAGLPKEIDLSIFDASERRSRSLTKLLNSTGNSGFQAKWFDELSARLSPDTLTLLIRAWMDRLDTWQYSQAVLTERLKIYLSALQAEEIQKDFFGRLTEGLSADSGTPLLFRHAHLLSWLTLYALYGCRVHDVHLNRFRDEMECWPMIQLYRLYMHHNMSLQPQVISTRQCTLCVQPLPSKNYFGRQNEMKSALEIMHSGGKMIVQGIGGIGKTEFVRQLLPRLIQSGIWKYLAFVQYEGSLSSSLLQAFPSLKELPPRDRISGARRLLERQDTEKTLLLMDNLSETGRRDPDLNSLASWGCDIIITTRLTPLEGFAVLTLEGLNAADSEQLFYRLHAQAQNQAENVTTLCAYTHGHPLAITLFANLCRRRFWPVEKLIRQLKDHGLSNLSFIQQASPLNLVDVFEQTFSTSDFPQPQLALMRLISLLPYRYWLPDALLPYARDIHADSDSLADSCQVLCDLGWLQSGPEGYAVHPLIAETVLLQHISADDFPQLCAFLQEKAESEDDLIRRIVFSCVLRMTELNLPLIRALARIEQLVSHNGDVYMPEQAYTLHRRFLDTHPHLDSDEADYWLALGMRDIVIHGSLEHLADYLQHILELGKDSVKHRICLYSILEFAMGSRKPEVAERFFEQIRPDEGKEEEMLDFLISYSVKQRERDQDPAGAIESLKKAEELLLGMHEENTLRHANLLYRWATCELDLSRPERARPLLEKCLSIMRDQGHAEHSVNMMSTRNTYAYTLQQVGEFDAALREYTCLTELYRQQQQEHTGRYASLRNNMAILLDAMGKSDQAKDVILETVQIDDELDAEDRRHATHLRVGSLILLHCGEYQKAKTFAEKALSLRCRVFGEDSPWAADARAVLALANAHLGEREEALALAQSAYSVMESQWGKEHSNTVNARKIVDEISRMGSSDRQ